jgi:transcriptional regulator with XRE-family HTH domain
VEIGNKIRRIRLQRGLTQEELADRCELSKGFISLLERDQTSPSLDTLSDILESLGTDLSAFFAKTDDEKIVFGEDDIFVKEDEEQIRGRIRWLVPSAQKNRMEPILIEMAPGGETVEDDPHEGEEFGYVLSGQVVLVNGKRRHTIKKGSSFCLHPNATHHLENTSKAPASVLWISTPPSF